jgi:hypothetical protein
VVAEGDGADGEVDTEADINLLSGKKSNQTVRKTLRNTAGGAISLMLTGNPGTAISSGANEFYNNKW